MLKKKKTQEYETGSDRPVVECRPSGAYRGGEEADDPFAVKSCRIPLDNPHKLREYRKIIARLQTEIRRRQLEGSM
jgi:hypothetical protein